MKDFDTIRHFISLRSMGYTYDEIKGEIGISKPTLIKWSKRYSEEIRKMEKYNFAELYSDAILADEISISINLINLKRYSLMEKKTTWSEEVKERAMEKLSRIFLKEIKSAEIILSREDDLQAINLIFKDMKE